MSESVATAGHASAGKPAMSVFERFLTFWVALCIIVGIALGQLLPGVFHTLGEATVAQVNIPVAVLVWLMIVPMLLKIDLTALGAGGASIGAALRPRSASTGSSSHSRWPCSPGSSSRISSGRGCRRIRSRVTRPVSSCSPPHLARPWCSSGRTWSMASRISRCQQVALNDTIMVVAFAPIVGLLLGLSSITVPWDTLILSVVLYIVVPVIVAQLWRTALLRQGGPAALSRMLSRLAPLSLCALLLTLVLLFGLQGEQIMHQPLVILLLAVPIIIQVYFNAGPRLLA